MHTPPDPVSPSCASFTDSVAPSGVAQADRLRRMLDDFQLEFDDFLTSLMRHDDTSPQLNDNPQPGVFAAEEDESGGIHPGPIKEEQASGCKASKKRTVRNLSFRDDDDEYEKIWKLKLGFETILKRAHSHATNNQSNVITAEDIFSLWDSQKDNTVDKVCCPGMFSRGSRSVLYDALGASTNEERIEKYKMAIKVLTHPTFGLEFLRTTSIRSLYSRNNDSRTGEEGIDMESYVKLMLIDLDDLREYDSGDKYVTLALMDIHNLFFVTNASQHLNNMLHLTSPSAPRSQSSEHVQRPHLQECIYECINCASGILVMINALTLGLSLDYDSQWIGWSIFDWAFTSSFIVELLLRFVLLGPRIFFSRPEIGWNLFDTLVVVMATIDAIGTIAFTTDVLSNISALRLLRFMRLTKYVRLIRLRMFKELRLLVSGVLVGYKTLLWSLILLTYLVYFMGIVARDVFGRANTHSCDAPPWGSIVCEQSLALFLPYRDQLVGHLGRSMYTMFRCFMAAGECTSPDGTPLGLLLWEIYGWPYALAYVLLLVFVIFGVFNLIMAVFVESTIERAKQHQRTRLLGQRAIHLEKAQLLKELIIRCCKGVPVAEPKPQFMLYRLLAWFGLDVSTTLDKEAIGLHGEEMRTKLSYHDFMRLLGDPKINETLDELDISMGFRAELFDILDANGDGVLDVQELVDGVMKLRGCDTADAVALNLMCRSLQRSVKTLQGVLIHRTRRRVGVKREAKTVLL